MVVEIQEISDDKVLVNDKLVYIDMDGNWTAKIELTQTEAEFLNSHLFATRKSP